MFFFQQLIIFFLFNNKRRIEKIEQLFKNEFKISDNKINKELLYYKRYKFEIMGKFLERKRKREKGFKITKNVFDLAREKLFKEKGELFLDNKKDIKKDIIKIIKDSAFLKDKKITIEYAFRIRFCDFYNLFSDKDNKDLLGVCFYQGKMLLINFNLSTKITIVPEDKEGKVLKNFVNYVIRYTQDNEKETDYPEKISSLENLLKYNQNRPSEIFAFKIYEIN